MAMIDRIQRSVGVRNQNVPGHSFEAALTLWFHDVITRTQIINKYSIPSEFEADLDKFKDKYDGFAQTNAGLLDQTRWVQDVNACVIALQIGEITKAQFNTFLRLDLKR